MTTTELLALRRLRQLERSQIAQRIERDLIAAWELNGVSLPENGPEHLTLRRLAERAVIEASSPEATARAERAAKDAMARLSITAIYDIAGAWEDHSAADLIQRVAESTVEEIQRQAVPAILAAYRASLENER